jgi:nucleoside-diphosphate-sugar epimerase
MKVLVTGGRGFIGHHCVSKLTAKGYEVHAVSTAPQVENLGVQWHQANLLDLTQTRNLVRTVKPSHLLHMAWNTNPGTYWNASENLNWVQASLGLLHEFTETGGERFVSAGTCAEYDWTYEMCNEITTPCRPTTLYGTAKYSTQLLVDSWANLNGLSSAWGRIFFLYGPGENSSRIVPSVIHSLLQGKTAFCTHGEQLRDFLYVEDVAAAFVALLESDTEGVVNIASGEPIALKDIVYAIAEQLGRQDLVQLGAIPSSTSDPKKLIANVERLKREVGFEPSFKLKQGINLSINSIKNLIK